MTKKPIPIAKSTDGAIRDTRGAPIIYCESAPGLGFMNGVVVITLAASVQTMIAGNAVEVENVVVAHLRMNREAALSIRAAIDAALQIANPTETTAA